ncbi:MAG TPA: KTSC domain-containing protein [Alphaproteobacteria bacterium]|jgi:hypothetical protein|nr:KTSC domain-containing protein [Alphaproteobacteria bacterium]
MPAIASRAISVIRYDAIRRELLVTFRHSGATYAYFDVPPRVYADFLTAESHGRFFSERIRDAYRYRMISEPRV